MKMKLNVSGQCECGSPMLTNDAVTIHCGNPECPHLGKKFKYTTVELEEIL